MAIKKSLVVIATMAAAVFGAALQGPDDCAAVEPSAELRAAAAEMAAEEEAAANKPTGKIAAAEVNVPVYIHVIAKSKSKADGYLSESDVRATIDGMNGDYSGLGFQFTVKGVDHTINAAWAQDQDEMGMKKQLRKGDYRTLNLYYLPTLGYNGLCYFPEKVTSGSTKFYRDGCTVRSDVHNNGQTTTHEVGHWLGLFHTFQDGCDPVNDMVADTPALINSWSCNQNDDSCPDMPGKDPVTNFMSYGTCRSVFTDGQAARMSSMYNKFRA
ncbi:hypothetical protein V2A60_007639 [Cordyceps javanica]|uniref:Metalloprotease 1 n=1 Tax=Cordyceps javanica TaxID=43265 RepID=A0A545VA84_9HYPO|nr:metalloprotease 1 [Cordyceps javanica]TQW09860.1 metalloprotease 1 [Cordyceps javanica]